jgi:hypothetical protein
MNILYVNFIWFQSELVESYDVEIMSAAFSSATSQ